MSNLICDGDLKNNNMALLKREKPDEDFYERIKYIESEEMIAKIKRLNQMKIFIKD